MHENIVQTKNSFIIEDSFFNFSNKFAIRSFTDKWIEGFCGTLKASHNDKASNNYSNVGIKVYTCKHTNNNSDYDGGGCYAIAEGIY